MAAAQMAAPGLEWEQTTLNIATESSATPVNATYRFRNTSDRPVTIVSANASCGCTVPTLNKTTYAPGESGELPVTHKPKPGAGIHTYQIHVQTDEAGGRMHTLVLQVTSNPRITLMPRVINWASGEARTPKNIDVRIKKDDVLRVTGAKAEPDVLDISISDAPEPGHQILVATPKPGTGSMVPGRVRVQLATEPPLPPTIDTQFFAVLR